MTPTLNVSHMPTLAQSDVPMPNLMELAIQGGWFMIPIGLASIVTLVFTLERIVGLRRGRNLPRRLIRKLRELTGDSKLDPRQLWEVCDKDRSPLANVVRVAVLKTGRPHAEVERAVEDAVGRETEAMMKNLRPINVVATIAPLIGLLGTVQGMIMAFMVTSTTTSTGTAKAQELAHGIYTALVTTFAGLCVAVVSVVLANFLEGRIESLLRHMEAIFLDLLPHLERYEGRIRVSEFTEGKESGIRVKQIATAAPLAAAGDTVGEVDRPVRKSTPNPERRVRKASVRTKPEAPSDKIASSTETLRANFDR